MKLLRLAGLLPVFALSAAHPQAVSTIDNAQGASPMASYVVGNVDQVNPVSGNLYLDIPLLSYPQRGNRLRLAFHIYYNDKVWFIMNWPNTFVNGGGGPPMQPPYWAYAANTTQYTNPTSLGAYIARDQHLDYGRDDYYSAESQSSGSGSWSMITNLYSYFLREANGAKHYIGDLQSKICSQSGTGTCPTYVASAGNSYIANDGSGYGPFGPPGETFAGPDGVQYAYDVNTGYETITDPQGNSITQNGSGWQDTLGRVIPGSMNGPGTPTGILNTTNTSVFNNEPIPGTPGAAACGGDPNKSRSWTVPAVSGSTQTYSLCYSTVSFQTAFNLDQTLNTTNYQHVSETGGSALMLSSIIMPNGQSYSFQYDQYLSLQTLTLPTGATISYTWINTIPLDSGQDTRPLSRMIASRTVSPGNGQPSRTWHYHWNAQFNGGGYPTHYWGVITDPDGNDVERELTKYGAISMVAYQGCSPDDTTADKSCNGSVSTLLKREDYVNTGTGTQAASSYFAQQAVVYQTEPTTITTTIPSSTGNLVSQTVKTLAPAISSCQQEELPTYDGQSQVNTTTIPNCNFVTHDATVTNYDFGSGQPGSVLSSTATTYKHQTSSSYAAAHLFSLPDTTTLSASVGGTPVSQIKYGYDETNASSIVGNLTSVTHGVSGNQSVTSTVYNSQGMPTTTTDANGHATLITYDSTGAFPSQIQRPTTANGVLHKTGYSHDSTTGKLLSTTDENNQVTTYNYADPLNRLTKITYPQTADGFGGPNASQIVQYSYTDTPGSLSVKKTATMHADGTIQSSTDWFDGMGEVIKSSPDGIATVDTAYDSSGRVASVSNPYIGSSSGTTSYAYNDGLGRRTKTTNADTSVQTWSYDGNAIQFTDESGNAWKRSSDANGRLTAVVEPNGATTNYSYRADGNLVSVTQGGAHQRSFTYDSQSRLLTAQNLESGITCYGQGDGTLTGCAGNGYDGNGNLLYKTDARGVRTNYVYDELNRLLSKTYTNDPTNTPASQFYYDGQLRSGTGYYTLQNDVGRLSMSETVGKRAGKQFSYDAMGRPTMVPICTISDCSYGGGMAQFYDLVGNPTTIGHPDQIYTQQTYDVAGRLTGSIRQQFGGNQFTPQSYIQSITYSADGSPNTTILGNGAQQVVTENNRLQIGNEQTLSLLDPSGANSQAVVSHNYCYAPGCASTLSASTAASSSNNGNIWGIYDALPGGAFSQSFTYDTLNRLTSFTMGSTTQNFTIDTLGNMSPLNGTTPLFTFDIGATGTNRITNLPCASTLPSGQSAYDAAGNQLCDTDANGATRIYTYDAENRISAIRISTNSTPFETYLYEADGTRASKIDANNNATSYFNWFGQTITDIGPNFYTDYIYANGQKVARVESFDVRAHLSGSRPDSSQTGNVWDVYVLPAPSNYQIKTGDVLGFRFYQNNARGAISIGFTDGTNSDNYSCAPDQRGDCLNAESVSGAWVNRIVNLGALFAGKTISYIFLEDAYGPTGQFDVMTADMTITSTNGTVTTIVGRGSTSSTPNGAYGCGAVNSSPAWPTTCATEQVMVTDGSDTTRTTIFTLGDHLGTAQTEFAAGGWPTWQGHFIPYGQELDTQFTSNKYKFTGKERDAESGLDNFGARYFGSTMGRFMSPDFGGPMGESHPDPVPWADLENPQSLNLYSYGFNNPMSNTDDDGHDVNVCDNNGTCHQMSNEDYQKAQQGNNGSLNVPTLDQVGSNGNGSGQFNATNITDSNGNSVGTATYISNGPTDYYANSAGLNVAGQIGATMNDPRTYAAWFGASAVGAVGLVAAGATAGELTLLGDISLTPTAGEEASAQRVLAQGGKKSVERAIRTLSKRLAEHQAKVGGLKGDPGSVYKEIATFSRQIEALKSVLK